MTNTNLFSKFSNKMCANITKVSYLNSMKHKQKQKCKKESFVKHSSEIFNSKHCQGSGSLNFACFK